MAATETSSSVAALRSRAPDSCLPDCAGSRAYDALAYDLSARFDWTARTLHARERIVLELGDAAQPVVELDSAVQIGRVHAGERDLPFAADAAGKTVRIDLSPLHPRRGPVEFTVDYTAGTSNGLVAALPRDADPVTARVVYTDSEPDRGSQWLVANHHPADRAHWSVELTVDGDEDVVANGERVADRRCDGRRTVRYEMREPLPTYLMAFAAGQLVHVDRRHGRVPLSLWYRRGLSIVPEQTLAQVADAMGTFERLMGPYPFARYSVVLLPDFPGGMENATITFNYESSAQGPLNFELESHELSHHWFGDWVTMHDFDDAWVKEGMATVLEVEADRARRDAAGSGRLFGIDYAFWPSDAIVDDSLHSVDKYTSGPYQRAAWLITQIRATVGEKAFWQSARKVLRAHALDSISGPDFIRSFAPALDQAQIDQLIASLPEKAPPAVDIAGGTGPNGLDLALTLHDPSHAILVPPTLRVVDASGAVGPAVKMAIDAPTQLTVPYGGYLASDEEDLHPDWIDSFTVDVGKFNLFLSSAYAPNTPAALTTLGNRSAAAQERTFRDGWPLVQPDDFASLYGALDSTNARYYAGTFGCYQLYDAQWNTPPNPWLPVMGAILQQPALDWPNFSYSYCGRDLATQDFAADFVGIAHALDAGNAARFAALDGLDYGNATTFAVLADVAAHGPSLQTREEAIRRLAFQAQSITPYVYVALAGDVPVWEAFFRDRMSESTSQRHFDLSWQAEKALADVEALPLAGRALHAVGNMTPAYQRQLICDAYRLASTASPAAWSDLQAAAQPWSTLAPQAQAVLADPTACAQPFAAPRVQTLARAASPSAVAAAASGLPANRPDAHVGEPRRLPAPPR